MNAAIDAVVRTELDEGREVFGIRHGYVGLISGNTISMGAREVDRIILGSARSLEFKTETGRRKALRTLHQHYIEGLVVDGNRSRTGVYALSQLDVPITGLASTIATRRRGA